MKVLIIEVNSCEGCLHCIGYATHRCKEAEKTIKDIKQIPSWCPLPDIPPNNQINQTA